MIGKKLSPVLEEMEATLWEYEAFNGAKTFGPWSLTQPE